MNLFAACVIWYIQLYFFNKTGPLSHATTTKHVKTRENSLNTSKKTKKQVRSLTLDRWTFPLTELLHEAGNANANKVWEAYSGSASFPKIGPDADRGAREAFIRAKYEHRRFLEPPYDPRCGAVWFLVCGAAVAGRGTPRLAYPPLVLCS